MAELTDKEWRQALQIVVTHCDEHLSTLGHTMPLDDHAYDDGRVIKELEARSPLGERMARWILEKRHD